MCQTTGHISSSYNSLTGWQQRYDFSFFLSSSLFFFKSEKINGMRKENGKEWRVQEGKVFPMCFVQSAREFAVAECSPKFQEFNAFGRVGYRFLVWRRQLLSYILSRTQRT